MNFISQNNRIYKRNEVIFFKKTKEQYGGLSNMAGGYPILINDIKILTSEALYQAMRYPDYPDIQNEIIKQTSPMTAKMISKKYRKYSREDWDLIKIPIMRWCLRLKLLNNWACFSTLLLSTESKDIVEESHKDTFWGAIPVDKNLLCGTNALGRLLMELREELPNLKNISELKINIPNMKLYNNYINLITIDPSQNMLKSKNKLQSKTSYKNISFFD